MLCSNGTVSSTKWADFFLVLTITMSGRSFETMIFTGRVPPVVVKPGISGKIWMLLELVPMAFFSCFVMFCYVSEDSLVVNSVQVNTLMSIIIK